MAIKSEVIMTLVVVKVSNFMILSLGILLEEYFGSSVCMEKILYEEISFSTKTCLFLLLILCYKTFTKFGISIIVILCIIYLFDI